MAKGSAMGLWRGKKGSSVFYRIANSNNKEVQGIREYNPAPANPQSNSQASQRLKMQAAQRVFGSLGSIIRRSWQGVKYGQRSYQKFLKYALSMEEGYPYVEKDSFRAVPGRYLISTGTLQPVEMAYSDATEHSSSLLVTAAQSFPSSFTIGELSTQLLTNNNQLQAGDQVTFVVCVCSASAFSSALLEAVYTWRYASFFIDETSEITLSDAGLVNGVFAVTVGGDGGNALSVSTPSGSLVASAIIVSRPSETGGYLRSTATLFVPDDVIDVWSSPTQVLAARRSYQRKMTERTSSDWPVEEGEAPETIISITINSDSPQLVNNIGTSEYYAGDEVVFSLSDAYEDQSALIFSGWFKGGPAGEGLLISRSQTYSFIASSATSGSYWAGFEEEERP